MDVLSWNTVHTSGKGSQPIVFGHGFGCDQNIWRSVAPATAPSHRIVLFDHVGARRSDLSAHDNGKYGTLEGYAADVLEICHELRLSEVVFVGHSVSATIGILAAGNEPQRFKVPVLVGQLLVMKVTGHCPNLSAPRETTRAIETFLQSLP